MKRLVCFLLALLMLGDFCACSGTRSDQPELKIKTMPEVDRASKEGSHTRSQTEAKKGSLVITVYAEPVSDGSVMDPETYPEVLEGARRMIPAEADAEKLLGILESLPGWMDDNIVDRMPFMFIGEFKFIEKENTYFFTEDGMLYYDHYFAELGQEGTAFLLSLITE